jgi:type IV pilus assembly protein PilO
MPTVFESLVKVPMSRKILVVILLMVVVGAIYFFLFFQSAQDEIAAKGQELKQVNSDLDTARQDFERFTKLTRDLETAKGELKDLQEILPTDRDVEGLMTLISTQAKAARLRLTNIVPEDEEEAEYYVKMPIKIEFRGTFHQVLHFFHLVESGITRLVNIENISLEVGTQPEEANVLKGSVLATTFMAKEPGSGQETETGTATPAQPL